MIQALQDEGSFDLGALYQLARDRFELALQILEDWRLQRHDLGAATASSTSAAAH